jgi:hypothetical protein
MTLWRVKRGVEDQTKAFLDGFNDVVPVNWLQFFDERELELMLCGMQELNVDEWEKHTVYEGGYIAYQVVLAGKINFSFETHLHYYKPVVHAVCSCI